MPSTKFSEKKDDGALDVPRIYLTLKNFVFGMFQRGCSISD